MSDAIRNVTINLNLQRGDIQSEEIKRELASIAAESAKMKADFEQLVRTAGNGLTTALEQSVASIVTLRGHAEKMMGGVGTSLQEAIAAQKALAETGRVYTDSMSGASRAGEAHTRLLDQWLKQRNALNDAAAEYERRAKEGVRDVTERTPATGAERETTPANRSTADDYREATVQIVEHREEIKKLNEELRYWNEQRQKLVDRFETTVMPQSRFNTEDAGMLDKINAINREIEQLKTETRREESRQPTPAQGARPAITPATGYVPEPTPATGAQPDSTPATGRVSQIPEITAALEAAGRTMERFQQLAENASGLKTWELAVKQNEALRDGLQDSANAMQTLVREARSLDEAAALGRELGAALAEVAETAGQLDSVETAAQLIADSEQKAMDVWREGHKEKMAMRKEEERSAKQWVKEQVSLDKELERLWKEHTAMQEEAAKEAAKNQADFAAAQSAVTRNMVQSGMAAGQLLGSLRLLGAENRSIDDLAKEFIFLQTSIQAMNSGYAIFSNVTEAVNAYRTATQLASASQAAMTATAGPAAGGATAVGAGATVAASGVMALNVAIGSALPLLAAVALAHYAWRKRQEENAQLELQIRNQIQLTTGTINARADALQRNLDLEKSIRAFQDQFRQVPKTKKEIMERFEAAGNENKRTLEEESRRVVRNQYQTAQDKTVRDNQRFKGEEVGVALAEIERRMEQQERKEQMLSQEMKTTFDVDASLIIGQQLSSVQKELKLLKRDKAQIEQESGIRELRSVDTALRDGTNLKEVAELSARLTGAGQFEGGDRLAEVAKRGANAEMQRVADAKAAVEEAKSRAEYELEEKTRMMQPMLEQQRFEDVAEKRGKVFFNDEGKKQNLAALKQTAMEGQQYGTGRAATFQRYVQFAESEGLGSDVLPGWEKAKREMDTPAITKILERIKEQAINDDKQNEQLEQQLNGYAEAIDGLRRIGRGFESLGLVELNQAAQEAAKASEEAILRSRAQGIQ